MPTSSGLYDTSTLTYDTASRSYDGYDAPLANLPSVGVFIAWTDTPYTVSPAWTEISQYVRQISIRRGRQDDLQQFGPGTASLVLDNRDRLFDPFNSSSPNFSNLKPRKQLKIVANWNGTEYPLYRGYVSGWPVEYTEAGLDSTVTIECFDLLGLIGATTIDRPVVDEYILSLNPRHYFPMSESPSLNKWVCRVDPNYYFQEAGTTFITPGGGSYEIPYTQSSFYQVNPLKPATNTPGVGCNQNFLPLYIRTPNAATTVTAADFSISVVLDVPNSSSALTYFQLIFSQTNTYLEVTSGGLPRAYRLSASSTYGTDIRDSRGVHLVASYSVASNAFTVYINGSAGFTGTVTAPTTGIFPIQDSSAFMYLNYGTKVQSIALFDRQMTRTEAHTLSEVLLSKYEMTSANRFEYYRSGTSIPTGMVNVSSAVSTTSSQIDTQPTQLVATLQKLAATEDGELFVDDQGVLQFYGRNDLFGKTRSNTSQMTFTDSGTGVGYDANSIRISLNADQVRNAVTVNATDGQSALSSDATSVSEYGIAAETVDTFLPNALDADTLADYRLAIYKNPKMQIEPFMSKGQANPSYNWPRLLSLELLDRVTFKRTPSVGSAIQKDLLVQSIEHRITPGEWQTVVNGSTRYTGWFILGVSLLGSTEDVLL
jgi:hypothetical protein